MYHHRIIVKRNYGPKVVNVQYETKISNLPIADLAPFDYSAQSSTALHTHEALLEMLAEGLGSRERALEILKDAMKGRDPIEAKLLPQTDTKLVGRLRTSSAALDERTNIRLKSTVRLKSGGGPAMTVTEIKSDRLVRCSWYEHDLPRTDSFDPSDLQDLG